MLSYLDALQATAGSIRVMGRDPRDADARVRTGAMLQVTRVPEMLRVREHIAVDGARAGHLQLGRVRANGSEP